MNRRAVLVGVLAVPLLTGCVYYNRMWSAERLARQARRAEARGDDGVARTAWAQAAAKAESVHAKHPGSKWADDAWVLHAEGAARGGSCGGARAVIGEALAEAVTEDALRERMALVAAECALALGAPVEAGRQLQPALASRDAGRRSRSAYLAGRTAEAQGDRDAAIAWYARSRERAAGPARVQVLLAGGHTAAALALMDTVARDRVVESEWRAMLAAVAARAGPAAATEALDRMLRRARVPTAERARLLLADADRRYAAGEFAAAAARYGAVGRVAPDAPEARVARVRAVRARAAQAAQPGDVEVLRMELEQATRGSGGGPEAEALARWFQDVAPVQTSDSTAFRAAELARDSLRATALAAHLFLAFAREHPTSLFAPKALIAALPLAPALHDSLLRVLDADYDASPYVVAVRGDVSPAYSALEDSLARALGFTRVAGVGRRNEGAHGPIPGPRGPWWDDVFRMSARPDVQDSVPAELGEEPRPGRDRTPADRRRPQTPARRPDP